MSDGNVITSLIILANKKHYLNTAHVFYCLTKMCFLRDLLERVTVYQIVQLDLFDETHSCLFLSHPKMLILLLVVLVIDLLVYLNGNNTTEGENNIKYASSYPMN